MGITSKKTAAKSPKMNPRSELPLKREKKGASLDIISIK
jgi:hypothetical protein